MKNEPAKKSAARHHITAPEATEYAEAAATPAVPITAAMISAT